MILSLIPVGPLPKPAGGTDFRGARALPSLSGNGAYLQYKKRFYELICSSTSCNWSQMKLKLTNSVDYAVMMYLPYGYTC